MLPLLPLALAAVPELIRMIAGDQAGAVAGRVAGIVHTVAGTPDPAEAQQRLAADPALAADLRVRLAALALDAQRAIDLAAEQRRQAELATLRTALEDTQGARATMQAMVAAGSPVAWGAPVVSILVTSGFFGILLTLIVGNASFEADVAAIINITIGALAAAFATVVNFWLGSSQGSRNKDATVTQIRSSLQQHAASPAQPAPAPAPAPVAPPRANAQDGDALFAHCLAVVLEKEGGFVDHPRDPGGATNLGITLATFATWRGVALEPATPEQRDDLITALKALSRREAAEIYRANYWLPMRCGDLPPGVALMTFDFGVNAGPRTAVRLLQRAAGVTDDGSVGPRTLAAVRAMDEAALVDALAEARLAYYRALKTFDVFGAGWTNRTQQVAALAHGLAS